MCRGPIPRGRTAVVEGRTYYRLDDGSFVPKQVYDRVVQNAEGESFPQTGKAVYRRYVELTYLRPYYAVPFFLVVFILFLYLLGKFMAAGIGSFFWGRFEAGHPPPAPGPQRLLRRQAGDRLLLQRTADEVHPGGGRRVSPHGHVEHRLCDQRGFPGHPQPPSTSPWSASSFPPRPCP